MRTNMKYALGAVLGLALIAGAPTSAFAQVDVGQQKISSLEFDQADVREALRALFKNVNVNYIVSNDVQGTVTVSLRDVTFEVALRNILQQVNATYRIEGGVYQIIRKPEERGPDPVNTGTNVPQAQQLPVRIRIRVADPWFIIAMLNGSQDMGMAPEISGVANNPGGGSSGFGGGGFGGGGFGGGGMGGGGFGGFGGGGGGGIGGGGFGGGGGGGIGGGRR